MAQDYQSSHNQAFSCAFSVNMAQNMYKWARLATAQGIDSSLYLHPHDSYAISLPQWEDFDGEFEQLADGPRFLAENPSLIPEVPVHTPEMCGAELYAAWQPLWPPHRQSWTLIKRRAALMRGAPSVRHGALMAYPGFCPYYEWARDLSKFDVVCAASAPFSSYASGKPYCLLSVGGDLQFDCGRGDLFGSAMRLAFSEARFLFVTNPHTLGHSRRLGMSNGVYLPYPMDTSRYCPGLGNERKKWVADYGDGLFILTTARLDKGVKGHSEDFFAALASLARDRAELRFVFLGWGQHVSDFKQMVESAGLQKQIIVLSPVGKVRLIDYYRSCDVVLDQLVYGYFGATALEAASVGKPVIMKIRADQYAPLYAGDVAPVLNASSPDEVVRAITALCDNADLRKQRGEAMRTWAMRNHGEGTAAPLMMALLRMAADKVPLPRDLVNPLCDPLSEGELSYHRSCLRPLVK